MILATVDPGAKLRLARMAQMPRQDRNLVADRLAEHIESKLGKPVKVTPDVIRNIELGKSKRWLDEYVDWANKTWKVEKEWFHDGKGSPSVPGVPDTYARELPSGYGSSSTIPIALYHSRPVKNPSGVDLEVVPAKTMHDVPAFFITDQPYRYKVVHVAGQTLAPLIRHGDYALFLDSAAPPDKSVVIVQLANGLWVVRGLEVDGNDIRLKAINPTQQTQDKLGADGYIGYLVAVFGRYDPSASDRNMVFDLGNALKF